MKIIYMSRQDTVFTKRDAVLRSEKDDLQFYQQIIASG